MRCPHCLKEYHPNVSRVHLFDDIDGHWVILSDLCPACGRRIVSLRNEAHGRFVREYLCRPKGHSRAPLSQDVSAEFADDYREACLVLGDSPKASAALSRRCLQHVLQEKGGSMKRNLADEIDEVMPTLPSHLAGMIDTVRVMGNFAAHPLKNTNTGEIIDVEPGEAEWLLETIEMLFDFYFVQPAEVQRRRDAINKKLLDAGKQQPLK